MRAKQKKDFRSHRLISNITIVLVGITTISSIIISNINNNKANAVDANSTATIRVKSTCSMTATVDTAHTATLINGIYSGDYVDTTDNNNKPYENGIGQTTIQTFCNDPYGYAIYAIGYTGGDTGVANGTNTVLHSSILGSDYDIHTGTATSGDTSNWAMKLTSVDGTYEPTILNDYDDYHAVPASYEKVAEYGNGTEMALTGSSLTTTYAVYISNTQPAGTYTGQVKYILVHPSTGLEPGTYYMQDVDQWADSVGIGEEIVAYDNRDNKSYTVRRMCMSGTMDSCSYEDSMLWMTQNLDLDLSSSVALNSINTDLNTSGSGVYSDGYVLSSDNIIYYTPSHSTSKTIIPGGYFEGFNGNNNPFSADPDAENSSGTYWYFNGVFNNVLYDSDVCNASGNQTCNFLNTLKQSDYFKKSPYEYNGSHGKVGNYYNWPVAIASNDSSSFVQNTYDNGNVSENPSNSICPRGWRLPRMANPVDYIQYNEFMQLNSVYNGGNVGNGAAIDGLIKDPVYMTLAGNINGGGNPAINGAGYYGGYWSSTSKNGGQSYFLYIGGTDIWVSNTGYNRNFGLNIRCVSEYK